MTWTDQSTSSQIAWQQLAKKLDAAGDVDFVLKAREQLPLKTRTARPAQTYDIITEP